MEDSIISLLALIVTLGVLITVHEFGHFWVARRLGIKVLRFSIGFGRPLWCYHGKKDGTEYIIAAIPFGGYVKMLDGREGPVPIEDAHRAFDCQSPAARIAVVLAGPLCNFLFAIFVYTVMFMIGIPGIQPLLDDPIPGSVAAASGFQKGDEILSIDDQPTPTLNTAMLKLIHQAVAGERVWINVRNTDQQMRVRVIDLRDHTVNLDDAAMVFHQLGLVPLRPTLPPLIGQVEAGGVAERVGLQRGDRLLSAAGQAIVDWEQWRTIIQQHPGKPLMVRFERDGTQHMIEIVPDVREDSQGVKYGLINARADEPVSFQAIEQYGPFDALSTAVSKTCEMSLLTLRMLGQIIIGRASLTNLSGPLTIAKFAGQAAHAGPLAFLSLLALLSISLGVLNLLPMPVLDGGHLLYYLIEVLKGSPLSEAAQYLGQQFGMVALFLLMCVALFNDVSRLG